MLTFHHAYRLEDLFNSFDSIWSNLSDKNPFVPLPVITSNKDIGRWLQLHFTKKNGINGSFENKLPAAFIHRLNLLNDPDYESKLIRKETMRWFFFEMFDDLKDKPEYQVVANYIKESSSKRFQLAAESADLFDRYMLYRPDFLSNWKSGNFDNITEEQLRWQAHLWFEFRSKFPELKDRAEVNNALCEAISADKISVPKTIFIFTADNLPPEYIKIINSLSTKTEVHWFRIRHHKDLLHTLLNEQSYSSSKLLQLLADEHKSTDGALSELIRDFSIESSTEPLPPPSTTLKNLQTEIRHGDETTSVQVDSSLGIHACHSKLREVQVLKTQILDFLEKNQDANPGDILVVGQDISSYEQEILSEFDTDEFKLPFRIATPFNSGVGKMVAFISEAMELSRENFKSTAFFHWLRNEFVGHRFGITTADLERLDHWVRQTVIRWGYNGASRDDEGQFSWKFGLNRIIAGSMLPTESESDLGEIITWNDTEGVEEFELLGKVELLLRRLHLWKEFSSKPHTLDEWSDSLKKLSTDLLPESPEFEKDLVQYHAILNQIAKAAPNFKEKVGYEIFRDEFKIIANTSGVGSSYRNGSILFSNMVPVRHLPYRFIGILGMNEETFPGKDPKRSFDLMDKNERPGDRSIRKTNKALFLDYIMSTKDKFCITYQGYVHKDGERKAPSLVVSELINFVNKSRKTEDYLSITYHKMHGFSNEYYSPASTNLYSYSQKELNTAVTYYGYSEDLNRADFVNHVPDEDVTSIHFSQIKQYLNKTYSWFMGSKLGMRKVVAEEKPEERDPFEVNALEKYNLRNLLIRKACEELDKDAIFSIFKRKGLIPYGISSRYIFDSLYDDVQLVLEELKAIGLYNTFKAQQLAETEIADTTLSVNGIDVTISSLISRIDLAERVGVCFSSNLEKHLFNYWIENLFLNTINHTNLDMTVIQLSKGETKVCKISGSDSEKKLHRIIELYLKTKGIPQPIHPTLINLWHDYKFGEESKQTTSLGNFRKKFNDDNNDDSFRTDTIFKWDDFATEFLSDDITKELKTLTESEHFDVLVDSIWKPFLESLEEECL